MMKAVIFLALILRLAVGCGDFDPYAASQLAAPFPPRPAD